MENENKDEMKDANSKSSGIKPDAETLGKTDPQEEMEGPLSSIMRKGGKLMETKEGKEDAQKRRDEKM